MQVKNSAAVSKTNRIMKEIATSGFTPHAACANPKQTEVSGGIFARY
jgi:hypothetical protein